MPRVLVSEPLGSLSPNSRSMFSGNCTRYCTRGLGARALEIQTRQTTLNNLRLCAFCPRGDRGMPTTSRIPVEPTHSPARRSLSLRPSVVNTHMFTCQRNPQYPYGTEKKYDIDRGVTVRALHDGSDHQVRRFLLFRADSQLECNTLTFRVSHPASHKYLASSSRN